MNIVRIVLKAAAKFFLLFFSLELLAYVIFVPLLAKWQSTNTPIHNGIVMRSSGRGDDLGVYFILIPFLALVVLIVKTVIDSTMKKNA